jgi:hypothetical protein
MTELLAAMFISVIIFGAAVTTFVEFVDVSTRSDNQTRAQDSARSTIERLAAHVRNAQSVGGTGALINSSSTGYDLIFLAPLPGAAVSGTTNPKGLYHVRYCLDSATANNSMLWFQTTPYNSSSQPAPPATATCPSTAWTTRTGLVDHLVNRSITGVPPLFTLKTDGATPPNITHVQLHAAVDWNPNRDPKATELKSTVNLRNLNRVPTAGLTCQGLANGHTVCDGSSSTDPDGQALTYTWSMDGVELTTETGARLDKFPLAAKSTHTFKLVVTDPGGATATLTRTVTMP